MSLVDSDADIPIKGNKDVGSSKKPAIDLVDIGEPLAKIVRENNAKAVQDYWSTQKRSQENLNGGFA